VAGIVLTGFTDPPALISAINRARVFRFLKKPWQPDDILEAVRHASDHVHQARAIERLVALLSKRTEELDASLAQVRKTQTQLLHMERLGTMGKLAAGVVHDLRNLMVSLGYIESVLQQRNVAPDVLESVQVGTNGVGNLIQTLEAMHQFARGGGLTIEKTRLSPSLVVQDAMAIARMDMGFRAHKVSVSVEENLPTVNGDRQKLTQVLLNLVRNAVQAMAGKGTLTLRTRIEAGYHLEHVGPERARMVRVDVEDTGPGIPEADLPLLFTPFFTRRAQGTGLGLAVAQHWTVRQGGRIQVASRVGMGTRMRVELPLRKPA
jgi:signal transduction histidine kinase